MKRISNKLCEKGNTSLWNMCIASLSSLFCAERGINEGFIKKILGQDWYRVSVANATVSVLHCKFEM
jgi:hypothetical protein